MRKLQIIILMHKTISTTNMLKQITQRQHNSVNNNFDLLSLKLLVQLIA